MQQVVSLCVLLYVVTVTVVGVRSRFLLWGFYALAATGITAANAVGVLLGHNISTSLVVLLPAGVLGFAASIAIYLVFLPPAWYLARLRAQASV